MYIELNEHQINAVEKLKAGSILVGGVGSGKSRTALTYFFTKEGDGKIGLNGIGDFSPMERPIDLYIITTARKRDSYDWDLEAAPFLISTNMIVDSWNNIKKYKNVKHSFFIFDEQRLVGHGVWVKTFLKIAQNNKWILLSATPGDTWMDYIPVFIANGFYKNRTEFIREHVVYDNYSRFPSIKHYIGVPKLIRYRELITINMPYRKHTVSHEEVIFTEFDRDLFNIVKVRRWNPYDNKPIKDVGELCYLLRKIVNSDRSRLDVVRKLSEKHTRLIIFYNFNYELDLLYNLGKELNIAIAQWNGHKHEPIPTTEKWIYLVQYTAGAEAWNCVTTNVIVFYSQNYSYKIMVQAAGRIDRLNTPYIDLYYYHLYSRSSIDLSIRKALDNKQNFNEKSLAYKT